MKKNVFGDETKRYLDTLFVRVAVCSHAMNTILQRTSTYDMYSTRTKLRKPCFFRISTSSYLPYTGFTLGFPFRKKSPGAAAVACNFSTTYVYTEYICTYRYSLRRTEPKVRIIR